MQRPAEPHPEIAIAALDIASRTWAHGSDGFLCMVDVLVAHGVPLAAFESRLGISHPLISNGSVVWSEREGGAWIIEVDGERIVEPRAQREAGANPLYADERRVRTGPQLVDLLPEPLAARVRDVHHALSEPLRVTLEGFTDACVCSLDVGAPVRTTLVCATQAPGGFNGGDLQKIHTAVWGLGSVGRFMRWRALCFTIARSYIGPQAGMRVVEGRIKRGDLERRQAVIWFSDLRNFTSMSSTLEPEAVVARLNVVFEHVGKSVTREGGEILKFIGDGALAIFPYDADAPDACRRALRAAQRCLARLPPDLKVGIGLHRGEVAYGNIGASDRLDFTVIGATVNIASRVEGVAGRLGKALLASDAVASCDPSSWRAVGAFALKGVPEEVVLHEPVEEPSA